jgi:hypothetical protein
MYQGTTAKCHHIDHAASTGRPRAQPWHPGSAWAALSRTLDVVGFSHISVSWTHGGDRLKSYLVVTSGPAAG